MPQHGKHLAQCRYWQHCHSWSQDSGVSGVSSAPTDLGGGGVRWLERAPSMCTAAFETPCSPCRSSVLHRGKGKSYYERIIKPAEKSKVLAGCNLTAQTTQQLAGISRKGWGALGEAREGSWCGPAGPFCHPTLELKPSSELS